MANSGNAPNGDRLKKHAYAVLDSGVAGTEGTAVLREYVGRLERQNNNLREQAMTDPLTGVGSRRYFDAMLDHKLEEVRRKGYRRASGEYGEDGPLSVLISDVDGLKAFNDSVSYQAGDTLLRVVARTLQRSVRTTDYVGRLGGDEFGVILPQADREVAGMVVARVLGEVQRKRARWRRYLEARNKDGRYDKVLSVLDDADLSIGPATTIKYIEAAELKEAAERAMKSDKGENKNIRRTAKAMGAEGMPA